MGPRQPQQRHPEWSSRQAQSLEHAQSHREASRAGRRSRLRSTLPQAEMSQHPRLKRRLRAEYGTSYPVAIRTPFPPPPLGVKLAGGPLDPHNVASALSVAKRTGGGEADGGDTGGAEGDSDDMGGAQGDGGNTGGAEDDGDEWAEPKVTAATRVEQGAATAKSAESAAMKAELPEPQVAVAKLAEAGARKAKAV